MYVVKEDVLILEWRNKTSLCICVFSQQKLVVWLRMILRNSMLIEYYYQPWSYVVKTGMVAMVMSTMSPRLKNEEQGL